jgi:hypothetical protein
MGRGVSKGPVPAEFYQQAFTVRQDGRMIWRERPRDHFPHRTDDTARFNNQRAREPAGQRGPNGRLMVSFKFDGHLKRIAASRVAWLLATGSWPAGVVRARNGDDDDLRAENLILVKAGPRPFDVGKGGEASSLVHRAKITATLIGTLAEHPGSTVPQLSQFVGLSAPCVCTRLGKLSDAGLTCGPKCYARAHWDLNQPNGRRRSIQMKMKMDRVLRRGVDEVLNLDTSGPLNSLIMEQSNAASYLDALRLALNPRSRRLKIATLKAV